MDRSGRRLFGVVNSGIPQGCPPHTAAEQAKLEIRSQLSPTFTAEQGCACWGHLYPGQSKYVFIIFSLVSDGAAVVEWVVTMAREWTHYISVPRAASLRSVLDISLSPYYIRFAICGKGIKIFIHLLQPRGIICLCNSFLKDILIALAIGITVLLS